jgi:acetylornithine deacetylase/succinyl-diaminopimelate desuccinylase-like protein
MITKEGLPRHTRRLLRSDRCQPHAPDEWLDLESVKNVTKVLALTTMDWCGVAR